MYSSDTDKQLHEKAIQDAAKKLTNEEYKLAVKMVPKIVDDKREKMNADWKKLNDAIEKSIKEQSKSWSSTKKADKSPSVKDYTTDEPEKYLPNKD